MDQKTASRVWVELNLSKKPKELKDVDLSTHEKVWTEMSKVAPLASASEVNRLWAESQGLTEANVLGIFGHP